MLDVVLRPRLLVEAGRRHGGALGQRRAPLGVAAAGVAEGRRREAGPQRRAAAPRRDPRRYPRRHPRRQPWGDPAPPGCASSRCYGTTALAHW